MVAYSLTDLMDSIRFSAPAERNRQPILDVLSSVLPKSGTVLEIASGTGQHVVYFAAATPNLNWQPSDPDSESRASIRARIRSAGLTNVADPLDLDVRAPWTVEQVDAIVVANLLHISPLEVLPALMRNAGRLLSDGGVLHVYGPFLQQGNFSSSSDAEFDASLRARNPSWGIRELDEVQSEAQKQGFESAVVTEMPANNYSLVFRRHG